LAGLLGMGRHGAAQAGQDVDRKAGPRLALSAGVFADPSRAQEGEERLDRTHDFAARASGIDPLVEKAKAGAAHRVNLLAAVWAFIRLGQKPSGQERAKEEVQVGEALLAQGADAFTQRSEAGTKLREEGRLH